LPEFRGQFGARLLLRTRQLTPTNLLMRLRNSFGVAVIFVTSICVSSACSKAQPANNTAQAATAQAAQVPLSPQDRQVYMDAARSSWNFVNSITEPSTGLARAHTRYSFITLW